MVIILTSLINNTVLIVIGLVGLINLVFTISVI